MNDTVTISVAMIPFLDVNTKVEYRKQQETESHEYIIDSITNDTESMTSNIVMHSTFVLTKDENDIYVEPVEPEPFEPEPYVPTEEEIAEQERQRKIVEINNQMDALKSQLSDTDYIFVKCYEASLVGESVDEYDFEVLHLERQAIREQINELETELETI